MERGRAVAEGHCGAIPEGVFVVPRAVMHLHRELEGKRRLADVGVVHVVDHAAEVMGVVQRRVRAVDRLDRVAWAGVRRTPSFPVVPPLRFTVFTLAVVRWCRWCRSAPRRCSRSWCRTRTAPSSRCRQGRYRSRAWASASHCFSTLPLLASMITNGRVGEPPCGASAKNERPRSSCALPCRDRRRRSSGGRLHAPPSSRATRLPIVASLAERKRAGLCQPGRAPARQFTSPGHRPCGRTGS